jgi:hypothetical protein
MTLEGMSGPPYTHSVVNLERGCVAKHGKDPLPSIQDPDCAKNMHTSRGVNSSWPSCMPIGVWPAVHVVFKTKLTSFPTSWLPLVVSKRGVAYEGFDCVFPWLAVSRFRKLSGAGYERYHRAAQRERYLPDSSTIRATQIKSTGRSIAMDRVAYGYRSEVHTKQAVFPGRECNLVSDHATIH